MIFAPDFGHRPSNYDPYSRAWPKVTGPIPLVFYGLVERQQQHQRPPDPQTARAPGTPGQAPGNRESGNRKNQ